VHHCDDNMGFFVMFVVILLFLIIAMLNPILENNQKSQEKVERAANGLFPGAVIVLGSTAPSLF